MGAPLVDIVTDCAAGELGGETKFSVALLNISVEGAGVTTSVTGMVTGATPVTVTVIAEMYDAAVRLVGFTRTVRLPGTVPLAGPTVSHWSGPGVVAVKVGVPALGFRLTVCAAGNNIARI
jgi:phosphoribosylcarboxyaminoimidazole (NCAIR) mutase